MNKYLRYGYIFLSIILLGCGIDWGIYQMLHRKMEVQERQESQLPYGDYLPSSNNPLIRVVLQTTGYRGIFHNEFRYDIGEGEVIINLDDVRFQEGSIKINSGENQRITILSIKRGQGSPTYQGVIELYATVEGIVIVNELPVEAYLRAVVPSEMPPSYEMEALKCQAVCARNYAYCQMETFAYPEYKAHVDDSVSFQVYANAKETERTNEALSKTKGERLTYQNKVIKTYYYSTSAGHSTSIEAWGSELCEENKYLCGVSLIKEDGTAYEEKLPWHQWEATISEEELTNLLELNSGIELGILKDIRVSKRGVGNIALQVVVEGTKGNITVDTENKIRLLFGNGNFEVVKQDGKSIKCGKLLPSAFFSIAKNGRTYIIRGKGYGHGIGMSQNGANEMAKTGMSYKEILMYFYPGTKVQ
jgi:stage II sporulation protein D